MCQCEHSEYLLLENMEFSFGERSECELSAIKFDVNFKFTQNPAKIKIIFSKNTKI